eukprot:3045389-Amphidinium_carterae.1
MQEQTTILTVVEGGSFLMLTLAYDMGASFSSSKIVVAIGPETETKFRIRSCAACASVKRVMDSLGWYSFWSSRSRSFP